MNARVAGVLLALTGFFVIVSATRIQTQTAAPDPAFFATKLYPVLEYPEKSKG